MERRAGQGSFAQGGLAWRGVSPWPPRVGLCQCWGAEAEAGPAGSPRAGWPGGALRTCTDPPSSELLSAAAQGAGTLQARMVSQPRALGPVPFLSAEQVRGTPGGGRACMGPTPPSRPLRSAPAVSVPGPHPAVQVPGLLPEGHRSQDVRSCGPGLHLPQLHHHRAGEARHRPRQHREAPFRPRGGARGRVKGPGRPLPPPCACRSASFSACPTTSSRRSSWPR